MGLSDCVVTNESSDALARRFPGFFDKIIVDAPCSGEGMFRKDEEAAGQWSPGHVTLCAARQAEILENASAMLRPGGRMVYSTCTFSPEENEGTIARFLERHPDFRLVRVKMYPGFAPGRPKWTSGGGADGETEKTVRLWPHRLEGCLLYTSKRLLGGEYGEFLKSCESDRAMGLRVNRIKLGRGEEKRLPFTLRPVPWTEDGYYYDSAERPGHHPYHEAGVYYIQEPSAMAVAAVLEPEPVSYTHLERCGMFYVNERWLGGMLTNFKTIQSRIARLKAIETMAEDGTFDVLPKKEVIALKKEWEKLEKNLGGIKEMKRIPDCLLYTSRCV